jgi:transcriptional regulator with PAS, ATPase and Fis domain
VAQAIHYQSPRRAGPFVKVSCAARTRDVIDGELFGYERGAFHAAREPKVGKLEAAHRGTILLDDVVDLDPDLQGKLLHVVQDGEVYRVGAKVARRVDVRVIATTSQDADAAVAAGRFREDLYYRLNVLQVVVPPLRERVEEIPLLAEYFVQLYSRLFQREGVSISPAVMRRLTGHSFRGNVRELENLVKRMVVLGDTSIAAAVSALPLETRVLPSREPVITARREPSLKEIGRTASMAAQREAIARVLAETRWNRVRAAKTLGVSYRSLLYKMKETGLGSREETADRDGQGR